MEVYGSLWKSMEVYGNKIKEYLQHCKLGGGESGFWAQETVVGTKGDGVLYTKFD